MSQSPASPVNRSGRREQVTEPDRPSTSKMLTPGSVVRLPVGYVWVAVVFIVAVAAGLYILGRSHGAASMQRTLAIQVPYR